MLDRAARCACSKGPYRSEIVRECLRAGAHHAAVLGTAAHNGDSALIGELLAVPGDTQAAACVVVEGAARGGHADLVFEHLPLSRFTLCAVLNFAAAEGRIAVMQECLRRGAAVSNAAVRDAVLSGSAAAVDLCLASPTGRLGIGHRAQLVAAGGLTASLQPLLASGISQSWRDQDLIAAAGGGHLAAAQLCFSPATSPGAVHAAVEAAAINGSKEVVLCGLTKWGADNEPLDLAKHRSRLSPIASASSGAAKTPTSWVFCLFVRPAWIKSPSCSCASTAASDSSRLHQNRTRPRRRVSKKDSRV